MTRTVPTLRIGGYQGPRSVHTAGIAAFAAALERIAGDALAIERTDDVTAAGGSAGALFADIEAGRTEAGYMASGYLTARVPELAVLDLPFTVRDRESALAALDGRAGTLLREAVEARTGYGVLGFWDNGVRHVTNRARPIRSPEDCRGLVIRTLDNAIYQEALAGMGFTPIVTDVRELREAVVTGRVDAQENPLTNTIGFDAHKHHPHVSLTGHVFGVALLVCHAPWLASLPHELRAHVHTAAAEATGVQRAQARAREAEDLAFLRAEGAAILAGDDLDLAAFRRACAPIVEREAARLDPALRAAYGV
ncbi:TRAP transporter substrate-binding protein [Salinarimonas ramus]|uniref:Uncharacterized protein n=1 Tax=Salinarimonas ramus TaxID=690164 RepID=A0A917Q8Z9_9HYPH|nr:TRAP transporter substrate-binding protein [Salinarimonas ramus]GGK35685.1 hypothetical protein GCM10011322_23230 [Salinarimonas ramus]